MFKVLPNSWLHSQIWSFFFLVSLEQYLYVRNSCLRPTPYWHPILWMIFPCYDVYDSTYCCGWIIIIKQSLSWLGLAESCTLFKNCQDVCENSMLPTRKTSVPQDNIHCVKCFALASNLQVLASICRIYTIEIQAVNISWIGLWKANEKLTDRLQRGKCSSKSALS